ncbi:hypothetical protein SUGI_0422010 [Cryptomeria japonica]|nr:hypothetical protein SUGI_0422010 [Cryptomeria japonica]
MEVMVWIRRWDSNLLTSHEHESKLDGGDKKCSMVDIHERINEHEAIVRTSTCQQPNFITAVREEHNSICMLMPHLYDVDTLIEHKDVIVSRLDMLQDWCAKTMQVSSCIEVSQGNERKGTINPKSLIKDSSVILFPLHEFAAPIHGVISEIEFSNVGIHDALAKHGYFMMLLLRGLNLFILEQ